MDLPGRATTASPPQTDEVGNRVVAGRPTSDDDQALLSRLLSLVDPVRRRCSSAGRRRPDAGPPPAAPAARRSRRRPTRSPSMPLSTGAPNLSQRVADELTDARTEVGQVGLRPQHPARPRRRRPRRAAPQRAAGAPVRGRRLPRAAHAAVHHPRVRRALAPYAGRRRRPLQRDDQGRDRGRPDVPARRGHAAARPARLRPAARARRGRPDQAAARVGDRRTRGGCAARSAPPLAAATSRGADRRPRRRAAAAPAVHQPARQRPAPHAAGHHRDRLGRAPGPTAPSWRSTTTAPACRRAWPSTRSSGSPAATPHAPARPAVPGSGLSLVAAIAQAHGGTASVHSEPGDTTFRITLPVG